MTNPSLPVIASDPGPVEDPGSAGDPGERGNLPNAGIASAPPRNDARKQIDLV